MDLKHRRRALYTGMRPYFDDSALQDALQLWQDKYSHTPKFAFAEFLSVCCQTPELRQQRSRILSAIFKAMDMPEHELLVDPYEALHSAALPYKNLPSEVAVADVESGVDGNTAIFMQFVESLLHKLTADDANKIRVYVIKTSAKLPLDLQRKVSLQDWLSQKIASLDCSYRLNEIRQLINFSYVAMCENYGPVKADVLLAQAIKEVEEMAAQKNVNLHDFL